MAGKNYYTWNCYSYCLINLTTGKQVAESDDLDYIKQLKKKCKQGNRECTYVIQQQHCIARINKTCKITKKFANMQNKLHKKLVFVLALGIWQCVAGDSGTLAEWLAKYEIIIDDNTEFARIRYNEHTSIWYRVVNAQKITIDIWEY